MKVLIRHNAQNSCFGTKAHVLNWHKNIRIVIFILLFKLTAENVGGKKLIYSDPYDFEDPVTVSQAPVCPAMPLCPSSSPTQFTEPEVLRGTNTAANCRLSDNHFSLYVSKTWSLTLKEEYAMWVSEDNIVAVRWGSNLHPQHMWQISLNYVMNLQFQFNSQHSNTFTISLI